MSEARIAQDVLVMKGMSKETLVLLYGGRSAEREVSVLSAESVMRAINYDKFLCFNKIPCLCDEIRFHKEFIVVN